MSIGKFGFDLHYLATNQLAPGGDVFLFRFTPEGLEAFLDLLRASGIPVSHRSWQGDEETPKGGVVTLRFAKGFPGVLERKAVPVEVPAPLSRADKEKSLYYQAPERACAECGKLQHFTPGGWVCADNNHGGEDSVVPGTTSTPVDAEDPELWLRRQFGLARVERAIEVSLLKVIEHEHDGKTMRLDQDECIGSCPVCGTEESLYFHRRSVSLHPGRPDGFMLFVWCSRCSWHHEWDSRQELSERTRLSEDQPF